MHGPIKRSAVSPQLKKGVNKGKKKGKTPFTRTRDGREVGVGGLKRRKKIDDYLDSAQ